MIPLGLEPAAIRLNWVHDGMARIAIATCAELPEPDHDELLLLGALRRAGHEAEMAAWDCEPSLAGYAACLIRSTWNYHLAPDRFRAWLHRAEGETLLLNPFRAMEANLHKSYLLDSASQGVPIVPTRLVKRAEDPVEALRAVPWKRFVVKPAISAGSYRTESFDAEERSHALAHLEKVLSDGDALIQEFLPSVLEGGEIAWVWIDGEVTHGVRKQPRFAVDEESVSEAIVPSDADLDRLGVFARQIPAGCLYARIDVMESRVAWLLSELELIEPSLFFMQHPIALDRFVQAVDARLAELPLRHA